MKSDVALVPREENLLHRHVGFIKAHARFVDGDVGFLARFPDLLLARKFSSSRGVFPPAEVQPLTVDVRRRDRDERDLRRDERRAVHPCWTMAPDRAR
jgi:hypothetical protein